jgi:hypothetical protein
VHQREDRGNSFCETISLSKGSCRDSNNSLCLDDSDVGDDYDRRNASIIDEDFDYKIKWFFDRIEQQET